MVGPLACSDTHWHDLVCPAPLQEGGGEKMDPYTSKHEQPSPYTLTGLNLRVGWADISNILRLVEKRKKNGNSLPPAETDTVGKYRIKV